MQKVERERTLLLLVSFMYTEHRKKSSSMHTTLAVSSPPSKTSLSSLHFYLNLFLSSESTLITWRFSCLKCILPFVSKI